MFHDELMCVFVSFHQKWNPFSTCKNKVQRSCLKYVLALFSKQGMAVDLGLDLVHFTHSFL